MFRAGAIFVLPNGREVMAAGDGLKLYAVGGDEKTVLRYELNEGGRLLLDGRLTAWDIKDLRDTNRTGELPPALQASQSGELVAGAFD